MSSCAGDRTATTRASLVAARPRRRRRLFRAVLPAIVALAAIATVSPLGAHDFWIEPSSFGPAVGEAVALSLRVGERFAGDPVALDPAIVERFAAIDAGRESAVGGEPGDEPAGRFRSEAAGAHWIVYDNRPRPIELDPRTFEAYLAEEGLEAVIAERRARGEAARPGRERYSRCAKALVVVGRAAGAAELPRELGLELELVLDATPETLAGGSLPLRVVFRGAPLAGARVVALPRAAPGARLVTRTDAAGAVRLELPTAGVWLIKAVHMVRTPEGSADADWESLWASLTLEVPPAHP